MCVGCRLNVSNRSYQYSFSVAFSYDLGALMVGELGKLCESHQRRVEWICFLYNIYSRWIQNMCLFGCPCIFIHIKPNQGIRASLSRYVWESAWVWCISIWAMACKCTWAIHMFCSNKQVGWTSQWKKLDLCILNE